MKPLLIIPPAPGRWPALQGLPVHDEPLWWDDLEKRFASGLSGSQDAFAVVVDGGHIHACACISKRHDLGVGGRLFTRPEYRSRGLARQLVETLLSWFDMTGGKWLYATTTADPAAAGLSRFGFRTIRRAPCTPHNAVVLLRAAAGVPEDPLATADGEISVHDVTRANWPSIVTLLCNRPGPDPRVPLDESAVGAEVMALELLSRQEAGTCHLKAAFRGPRLIGLASVATDTLGDRTYAMVMPHTDAQPKLREAIVDHARAKGYEHVDFPMETLTGLTPTASVGIAKDQPNGGIPAPPELSRTTPAEPDQPVTAPAEAEAPSRVCPASEESGDSPASAGA